jgi:hypothetical protein
VVRFALIALLFWAIPASPQGVVGTGSAVERAMRCVHAAMDALLPVGAMPEQLASAAIARCVDEIEGAAAAAIVGSQTPASLEVIRVTLRRELYEYALQVGGLARWDNGYAAETLLGTVDPSPEAAAASLRSSPVLAPRKSAPDADRVHS